MPEQRPSNPSEDDFTNNSIRQPYSNTIRRVRTGAAAGLIGLAIGVGVVGFGLFAGPKGTAAERSGNGPAVIELFTSQGCYSCPPAEKLLGELVESDPDLIALEFHVDYWDSLVYGRHGSHKDPFSDKENTYRQQLYNRVNLGGQRGVFTPQMVINGRYATVGSQGSRIRKGIEVLDRPSVDLTVTHDAASDTDTGSNGLRIELTGDHSRVPESAHLWIAVFDIEKTTNITTGENHDKTLTSHHIVRQFNQLTPKEGFATLVAPDNTLKLNHQVELKEGQGCAVLLQEVTLGPVYGAAYCPDVLWRSES